MGCSAEPELLATPNAPAETSHGSLFAVVSDHAQATTQRYEIDAVGNLGPATDVVAGVGDSGGQPGVVDAVGDGAMIADYDPYWTTAVATRNLTTGA